MPVRPDRGRQPQGDGVSATAPTGPGSTAERTALWRALHLEVDAPPPIHADAIAVRLVDPPPGWRERPDMHPVGTRGFRASIVVRARAVEDELAAAMARGVDQYVLLGAGLDTFAQRHPDVGGRLRVFEIDTPALIAWKRARLQAIGLPPPPWLHLLGVDASAPGAWWEALVAAGWEPRRPTVLAAVGLSMYLPRSAVEAILREAARLARGSVLLLTYLLPVARIDPVDQPAMRQVLARAAATGTPMLTLLTPEEARALASAAGFRACEVLETAVLAQRYCAGRADGLRPASGEGILIAST